MKLCKNCNTLYSSSLSVCPKCGVDSEAIEDAALREAKPGEVRRQWTLILLGVPLLIILLYGIALFVKQ